MEDEKKIIMTLKDKETGKEVKFTLVLYLNEFQVEEETGLVNISYAVENPHKDKLSDEEFTKIKEKYILPNLKEYLEKRLATIIKEYLEEETANAS